MNYLKNAEIEIGSQYMQILIERRDVFSSFNLSNFLFISVKEVSTEILRSQF